MDVTPVTHRYSSYGILITFFFVVGAIGPSIVEQFRYVGGGAAGIRAGLLWLLPAAFAGALFYGINCKFYPKDSQNVSDTVLAEK
jgi:hypothetical protein